MSNSVKSYIELANIVSANISAPTKYELIQKAQERLVSSLKKAGAISSEEGDELLI